MVLAGIGATAAISVMGVVLAGFMVYQSYANELVPPDELAINQPSFGAIVLDRHDRVLYEYVDDRAGLRRPTPLTEIAPAFLAATISTEDNSFFTNPGVNIQGLARAVWENSPFGGTEIFGGSGGSSITQQLVKNVYIDESARSERWSSDGINRKVQEIVYALELTGEYNKSRILEWYVNQISYGGVFNGVEAATLGYLGKPASELTLAEAALLAGIPQSPAAYDPRTQPEAAEIRRNQVLDLMVRQSPIQIGEDEFFTVTQADADAAKNEPIVIQQTQFDMLAPHWVLSYIEPKLREMLGCPSRAEMQQEFNAGTRGALLGRPGEGCTPLFTEGLIVRTTLDLELQDGVTEILEEQIQRFEESSNTRNGSIMVMDPHTGEILVMVGSRDYYRDDIDGRNNNATACNSPGSALKPFVFLAAFEEFGWGPGTYMLDTPVTYTDIHGDEFTPRNPAGDFAGPITIRNALGNSLNIPANKAADAVGPQNVVELGRRVGFVDSFRMDGCAGWSGGDGYGPAIATGGVDVTLEEVMYGYTTLATGGIMRGQEPTRPHDDDERQMDPVSILYIEDNQGVVRWDIRDKLREARVVDEGYAYLVWDVLTDSNARCRTFGCGLNVSNYTAGVKTGTSQPYLDDDPVCGGQIGETWAFGYSPDLVVGVWAGNADNSCLTSITSADLAFNAMSNAFNLAHEGRSVTVYERPDSVVEADACVPSGGRPTPRCQVTTRDLWVEGDEPSQDDTWWREVEIDIRNGNLASSLTPPVFRQRQVMLVIPAGVMSSETASEWARVLGIRLAPSQESDGRGDIPEDFEPPEGMEVPGLPSTPTPTPSTPGTPGSPASAEAAIFLPVAGAQYATIVQVIGRAEAPDFRGYRLEVAGPDGSWSTFHQSSEPQRGGMLGVLNVSGMPAGDYTIRLVVESGGGEQSSSVSIRVNN